MIIFRPPDIIFHPLSRLRLQSSYRLARAVKTRRRLRRRAADGRAVGEWQRRKTRESKRVRQ